jgi:signal transduction histidine kinase
VTRRQALQALNSEDVAERVAAAQLLLSKAKAPDLAHLVAVREKERSPWVLHLIEQTIASLGGELVDAQEQDRETSPDPQSKSTDLESRIVYEVAKMVIHELAPIVGRLEFRASTEVERYEDSRTAGEIAQLKLLTSALQNLASAAGSASFVEVELGELVRKAADRALAPFEAEAQHVASFAGVDPFFVEADSSLLELVLSNALRNAYESVTSVGAETGGSIVVTWGAGKASNWIAVRDSGGGLKDSIETLLQPDHSTKGHTGFGLYTATLAARSLGGKIELRNAAGGGAVFRVEWPRR